MNIFLLGFLFFIGFTTIFHLFTHQQFEQRIHPRSINYSHVSINKRIPPEIRMPLTRRCYNYDCRLIEFDPIY